MSVLPEAVNGPAHYNGTEVIDGMVHRYGQVATAWFCVLSDDKYRLRAGKKPGNPAEQDLAKGQWLTAYAGKLPPPPAVGGFFARLRLCWHVLAKQDSAQVRAFAQQVGWAQVEQALATPFQP
jgi:hypothetical protein